MRGMYTRFLKAAAKADGKTHKISFDYEEVVKGSEGETEPVSIISVRVEDAIGLVEGSIVGACLTCKAPVGLSPHSQKLIAVRPDARVLCAQCATKEMEAGGPSGRQPTAPK